MKKIILGVMVMVTVLVSCKKEVKDVSKIYDANASKMELIGDAIYAPPAGTTVYTDPGAKFTDDDGSVKTIMDPISLPDLSKAGFYSVGFKATSIHGYVRTANRLVLVTKVDAAVDLSGKYVRGATGQSVTITKLGAGLYKTDNVGGVPSNPAHIYDVYFGQINDSTLAVPAQETPMGILSCKNATVKQSAGKYTISWAIVNDNYGPADRIFVQQ